MSACVSTTGCSSARCCIGNVAPTRSCSPSARTRTRVKQSTIWRAARRPAARFSTEPLVASMISGRAPAAAPPPEVCGSSRGDSRRVDSVADWVTVVAWHLKSALSRGQDAEPAPPQLSIGDVAREAGVSASRIRYYESIGILPAAERLSGKRRYRADAVDDSRSSSPPSASGSPSTRSADSTGLARDPHTNASASSRSTSSPRSRT
jgi:MerR-like DNA binding protein